MIWPLRFLTYVVHGEYRRWMSWPVRLRPHHLEDLRDAVASAQGRAEIEANGRTVTELDEIWWEPRVGRVHWVKIDGGSVVLHAGPRSLYAYAKAPHQGERAALLEIESICWSARRRFGAFLLRTWGGFLATGMAVALAGLAWAPTGVAAKVAIGTAGALGIASVLGAAYYGVARRVAFVSDRPTFWRENAAALIATALVGTASALVGTYLAITIGD